eukprot:TRINITY_DN32383_c0_g2_i1.p1 TRINITY_DN32383_c0_g2~~TRINITY_DN32383_c0_g2_i1.p1  ORF type:complete len:1520 (-),score=355.71 TRINITY_DN32383_c0_g2_i1:73-4632(-)
MSDVDSEQHDSHALQSDLDSAQEKIQSLEAALTDAKQRAKSESGTATRLRQKLADLEGDDGGYDTLHGEIASLRTEFRSERAIARRAERQLADALRKPVQGQDAASTRDVSASRKDMSLLQHELLSAEEARQNDHREIRALEAQVRNAKKNHDVQALTVAEEAAVKNLRFELEMEKAAVGGFERANRRHVQSSEGEADVRDQVKQLRSELGMEKAAATSLQRTNLRRVENFEEDLVRDQVKELRVELGLENAAVAGLKRTQQKRFGLFEDTFERQQEEQRETRQNELGALGRAESAAFRSLRRTEAEARSNQLSMQDAVVEEAAAVRAALPGDEQRLQLLRRELRHVEAETARVLFSGSRASEITLLERRLALLQDSHEGMEERTVRAEYEAFHFEGLADEVKMLRADAVKQAAGSEVNYYEQVAQAKDERIASMQASLLEEVQENGRLRQQCLAGEEYDTREATQVAWLSKGLTEETVAVSSLKSKLLYTEQRHRLEVSKAEFFAAALQDEESNSRRQAQRGMKLNTAARSAVDRVAQLADQLSDEEEEAERCKTLEAAVFLHEREQASEAARLREQLNHVRVEYATISDEYAFAEEQCISIGRLFERRAEEALSPYMLDSGAAGAQARSEPSLQSPSLQVKMLEAKLSEEIAVNEAHQRTREAVRVTEAAEMTTLRSTLTLEHAQVRTLQQEVSKQQLRDPIVSERDLALHSLQDSQLLAQSATLKFSMRREEAEVERLRSTVAELRGEHRPLDDSGDGVSIPSQQRIEAELREERAEVANLRRELNLPSVLRRGANRNLDQAFASLRKTLAREEAEVARLDALVTAQETTTAAQVSSVDVLAPAKNLHVEREDGLSTAFHLENVLVRCQTEETVASARIRQLEIDLLDARSSAIDRQKLEIEVAQASHAVADRKNAAAIGRHEEVDELLTQKIELQTRLRQLETFVRELKFEKAAQSEELRQFFYRSEATLGDHDVAYRKESAQLQAFARELFASKMDLSKSELSLEEESTEVLRLKSKLAWQTGTTQDQLQQLQLRAEDADTSLAAEQRKALEFQFEISDLSRVCRQEEAARAAADDASARDQQVIAQLRADVQRLRKSCAEDNDAEKREVMHLSVEVDDLQRSLSFERSSVGRMKHEVAHAQSKVSQLETERMKEGLELNGLRTDLIRNRTEASQLLVQRREMQEAEAKLDAARRDGDALRVDFIDTEDKLRSAERRERREVAEADELQHRSLATLNELHARTASLARHEAQEATFVRQLREKLADAEMSATRLSSKASYADRLQEELNVAVAEYNAAIPRIDALHVELEYEKSAALHAEAKCARARAAEGTILQSALAEVRTEAAKGASEKRHADDMAHRMRRYRREAEESQLEVDDLERSLAEQNSAFQPASLDGILQAARGMLENSPEQDPETALAPLLSARQLGGRRGDGEDSRFPFVAVDRRTPIAIGEAPEPHSQGTVSRGTRTPTATTPRTPRNQEADRLGSRAALLRSQAEELKGEMRRWQQQRLD